MNKKSPKLTYTYTPPKKTQKYKEHLMTLDEEDFIPKRVVKTKPKPRCSNFRLEQKTEE